MIEVRHVTKGFDGFFALEDLTMTIPEGSIYGLVGPNGAGKTTILRHMSGAYRPDSGQILFDGAPVFENAAIKRQIATVPDELYFFGSDSTRDMMRFYRRLYPRFSMERYEALRPAFPEIDERRPIRRLSKGMQKQSAFWLALSCRPAWLLLDEPVDGLDPVMRRQVWSLLMEDVAANQTTIVVSSHNLRELEDVCDHVGLLNHGRLALERSLAELQGQTSKIQVAFRDGVPEELAKMPMSKEGSTDGGVAKDGPEEQPGDGIRILNHSESGRMHIYIVRGDPNEALGFFSAFDPLFAEALPLTLEEIFIYEMEGEDYAVRDIIL